MRASGRPSRSFRIPLVGQQYATRLLESWLAGAEFPPLLFTGPDGVGKRTAALLLAQAANCTDKNQQPCGVCRSCRAVAELNYPDLKLLLPIRLPKKNPEIEDIAGATLDRYPEFVLGQSQPVSDTKLRIPIHAVRWLRVEMARPPLLARRRFFILVNAHQMNAEAANALLKMLEEPQAKSTFVLTSSRPAALPATIRSRCQAVRFSPIAQEVVRDWLLENAGASSSDAELASSLAGGSVGTALRFLENRQDFLVGPVVDYFAGRLGDSEQAVMSALAAAKEAPPAAVTSTLLFLYQEAMRVKMGGTSVYANANPDVIEPNAGRQAEYLRRAVKFLLSRSREAGTNVNARLFNYSLLSTLKPPARRRLPA